jgi:putative SOS response-associated peptidase YedK
MLPMPAFLAAGISTPDLSSGKSRRPFHFDMKDDSCFAFAGIWDCWKSPGGKLLESCSILTTTPNELVQDIHDRMPVILPKANYDPWITFPPKQAEGRLETLISLDGDVMRRYEVSPLLNSQGNDSSECLVEATAIGRNLELFG